jgi:hypothetical protein
MKTGPSTRLAAAVCLLATGCLADPLLDLGYTDPILEECSTTCYEAHKNKIPSRLSIDILVVVDNSISMAEEQANLATEMQGFLRNLLIPPIDPATGSPLHIPVKDIHIGVISTDMGTGGYHVETCTDPVDGDDGILQHASSPIVGWCDPAYPNYLSYEFDEPDEEAIDKLARDFGCIATLGMDGCGFEQPLKAVLKALTTHADRANAGFLRPDSILAVVFLTDEDDCSVAAGHEEIFDTTRSDLGHLNLRCFHNPHMAEPIETYVEAFRELRPDPGSLIMTFIGGVPPDPMCEGFGDEIPHCLAHPDMIENVDPVSRTRLEPACTTSVGLGMPARRLVKLAQEMGSSALVRSICTGDYRPALDDLTHWMHWRFFPFIAYGDPLLGRDPDNPCLCRTRCKLVEMLSNDRPCPPGKPCVRSASGACRVDRDGEIFRSLCTIPEIGTLTSRCDVECIDRDMTHAPNTSAGAGWWYMGQSWMSEDGYRFTEPTYLYTEGMEPDEGSVLYRTCEECLGPPRLPPASGGTIGTPCSPETCRPALDEEGEPLDQCGWESQWTYIAEAEECGGGACLVFRFDDRHDPHCSRRCGPSNGGKGCPDGYACYPTVMHEDLVPGCWCVEKEQLRTEEGSPDLERMLQCR